MHSPWSGQGRRSPNWLACGLLGFLTVLGSVRGQPIVTTGPFFHQTTNSLLVSGNVTPAGAATSACFQYGADATYGNSTPAFSVGGGNSARSVTNLVTGLFAGQVGHYRLVAWDANGTNFGGDKVFSAAGFGGAGGALSLAGVDQFLSSPGFFGLYYGSGNGNAQSNVVTVEMWIKPKDFTSSQESLLAQQSDSTGWNLLFKNHGTLLSFGLDPGMYDGPPSLDASVNPNDFLDGRWHHVAATYDGARQVLYQDGNAIAAMSNVWLNPLYDSNTNLTVGGGVSPHFAPVPQPYLGLLDEFRVWSVARSATQIVQSMNCQLNGGEEGLIGYWRFDEPRGPYTLNSGLVLGNGGLQTAYQTWLGLMPAYYGGKGPLRVISTAPLNPLPVTVSFAFPGNFSFVTNFSSIAATAVANPGVGEISGVTFALQRWSDSAYWNGTGWGAFAPLGMVRAGAVWVPTGPVPTGTALVDGPYFLSATASTAAGRSGTNTIAVTVTQTGIPAPATHLANGNIRLHWATIPDLFFIVEASTDLTNWTRIGEVRDLGTGILEFDAAPAPGSLPQFYRLQQFPR